MSNGVGQSQVVNSEQRLRTKAEVDADIALIIRRIVTPDDTDTAQDSGTWDRIRTLCKEPFRC